MREAGKAKELGLPALLNAHRDLALVVAGVVASGSKPGHHPLVGRRHAGSRPGVTEASSNDVHAALDWLAEC